jgi:PPOX class probable F420-dependent enzyme
VNLSDEDRAFLEQHHTAAMITLRPDGTSHAARVAVALIDGKLWSSGTKTRVRTRNLRRDPRCTLFVFDPAFSWLTLETQTKILDGPEVLQQTLQLFTHMQAETNPAPNPGTLMWFGQERAHDELFQMWTDEQRVIYEFEPLRSYGIVLQMPPRPD